VLSLWRAFTTHGPVVTITPDGIRDVRVAAGLIPWSAVNDITVAEQNGQRWMMLDVDPAVVDELNLTRIVRWTRPLRGDGLFVTAQGLKIRFDELLETSLAYARAWHENREAAPAHAQDGDANR
jgi:hypothetical protein